MNSTLEAVNSASALWWPYVFHVFWQTAVVAAIVLAIVRFGRRLPSAVRSELVLIAFAKFLVHPVLPLPMGLFSQMDLAEQRTVAAEEREPETIPRNSLADPIFDPSAPGGIVAEESRAGEESELPAVLPNDLPDSFSRPAATTTVPATELAGEVIPANLSWRSWLLLLHGLGTLAVAGWVVRTAVRLQRMRRSSKVVDEGRVRDVFNAVGRELKMRRAISLRVSSADIPPMAFGVFRPTVLLPAALVDELNSEELRTICAHELAHHKRWDPLMNSVQAVILAVWWFHPLVWLLHRAARDIREDCCDDLILSRRLTTATVYCQLLVRLAERLSDRVRPPRLTCAEQMHPVQARMLRVMDTTLPRTPRLSLRGLAAVVVVACLLLPGIQGLSGGAGDEERRAQPLNAPKPERVESATDAATVRRDLYGDPLPAGALVRMGTTRFRHNASGGMSFGGGFLSDNIYVSYTNRGRIGCWDVRTGRIDREHDEVDLGDRVLRHLQVLPDGETIVTLCTHFDRDKRELTQFLQFWKEGQLSKTITSIESLGRITMALTPDGGTIVTGNEEGELKFWDRASGNVLLVYQFPDLRIESIEFSPDGQTFAVAGFNTNGPSSVYVWEWRPGHEPVALKAPERWSGAVTFSPDGRLLAIGTETGVRVWDVESQRFQGRLKGEATSYLPKRMEFTGDGRLLAVPTRSNKVELWNVSTGQIERTFETGAEQPLFVSISPDDRWLVASGSVSLMRVWNLKSGKPVAVEPGHASRIFSMSFAPDGKKLVTAGQDHTIRIWNAETGKQEHKLRHVGDVWDVAVSPDGNLIASNSSDDTVGVWDVDSGKQIYRLFGHGRLGGTRGVAFSPDGKKLLSWGPNLALRVWDVQTGKALADSPIRPAGVVIPEDESGEAKFGDPLEFAIGFPFGTFTPDGQRFLLAWRQTVSIFDVTTGKELRALQINKSVEWRSVSSSSDGRLMTTIVRAEPAAAKPAAGGQNVESSQQHVLQIRSIETGEVSMTIPLPDSYTYVRPKFSPDDQLVAAAPRSPDIGIHVYEVGSGRLRYLIPPVARGAMVLAFSPDGSRLATADFDTTILLWDLQEFEVENE